MRKYEKGSTKSGEFRRAGFAPLILLIFVPLLIGILYLVTLNRSSFNNDSNLFETYEEAKENLGLMQPVDWQYDATTGTWQPLVSPPPCKEPLEYPAPTDVSLVSGIIYPGQIRGTDYKPHGGFRFDTLDSNEVDVYAPMEGSLFRAARHLESGEIQYSLYFMDNCGIMYKLDHLLELTEKFNEILERVPMGGEGDSRTTELRPAVRVTKGEHVATKVGFENFEGRKNIFFDFGVYDLRKTNGVIYDESFRANHPNINEYGIHAICWLDYLEEPDKTIVKNLPAGGNEGKVSDYCD